MKALSRVLAVVVLCSFGIATAHYKLKSDLLKIENEKLKDRNKALSSAYQLKNKQLIKIKASGR